MNALQLLYVYKCILFVVLSAYEQALSLSPNNEDKSQVFAALGMVMYKNGDTEGAKSALFNRYVKKLSTIMYVHLRVTFV